MRNRSRSSNENDRGLTGEPCARRLRPFREHVPACFLERVERGEPASSEQADGAAEPAADPGAKLVSRTQQRRGALRLEAQQRLELAARPIERRAAEATDVLLRKVDAAELEVARHVLEEVDELETRAH